MPVTLSNDAAAQWASILANEGMTPRVRTLATSIVEFCDDAVPMNWHEDVAALGFIVPDDDEERETFLRALGGAFGRVATELTKVKRSARIAYVAPTIDDEGNETTAAELVIAFRLVSSREK
jgi:hypothetical protein